MTTTTKKKLRAVGAELHGALTESTSQLGLYASAAPADAATVAMVTAHREIIERTRAAVADEEAERFTESRTSKHTAAKQARNFHE